MKKQISLGEQVRQIVNQSGLTHNEIAKRAKIQGSTLQRVMSSIPPWGKQIETARKILEVLDHEIKILSKKQK